MSYLKLKGVTDYGDFSVNTILRESLMYYFNWGFLEIGAFQNVPIASSGAYGADDSRLRPVKSSTSHVPAGKVWESNRQNWVWESGLSYTVQPIQISGIYVNNTFQPATGVGPNKFTVDYPNGNIVFDSPIATSSTVQCAYSYKRVKFTDVDNEDFKRIQNNTLQNNNSNLLIGSGNNAELARYKLQTPCVAIEPIPRRYYPAGLGLGGGTYLDQDVLFHIFAETSTERDKIFDIITNQHNSTIVLVDINKLADNNAYPINTKGNIVNQANCNYNNLVGESSQYGKDQCVFKSFTGQESSTYTNNLFGAIARLTAEIPMGDV